MDDDIETANQAATIDNSKIIEKTVVVEKKSTSGWFWIALILAGIMFSPALLDDYDAVIRPAEIVSQGSIHYQYSTYENKQIITDDTFDVTNTGGIKAKNVQVDYSVKFNNRLVGTNTVYFGDIEAGSNKVKIMHTYVTLTNKEWDMVRDGVSGLDIMVTDVRFI